MLAACADTNTASTSVSDDFYVDSLMVGSIDDETAEYLQSRGGDEIYVLTVVNA